MLGETWAPTRVDQLLRTSLDLFHAGITDSETDQGDKVICARSQSTSGTKLSGEWTLPSSHLHSTPSRAPPVLEPSEAKTGSTCTRTRRVT